MARNHDLRELVSRWPTSPMVGRRSKGLGHCRDPSRTNQRSRHTQDHLSHGPASLANVRPLRQRWLVSLGQAQRTPTTKPYPPPMSCRPLGLRVERTPRESAEVDVGQITRRDDRRQGHIWLAPFVGHRCCRVADPLLCLRHHSDPSSVGHRGTVLIAACCTAPGESWIGPTRHQPDGARPAGIAGVDADVARQILIRAGQLVVASACSEQNHSYKSELLWLSFGMFGRPHRPDRRSRPAIPDRRETPTRHRCRSLHVVEQDCYRDLREPSVSSGIDILVAGRRGDLSSGFTTDATVEYWPRSTIRDRQLRFPPPAGQMVWRNHASTHCCVTQDASYSPRTEESHNDAVDSTSCYRWCRTSCLDPGLVYGWKRLACELA